MGMLMRDEDIYGLVKSNTSVVDGMHLTVDPYHAKSPIQTASIDLTIGRVWVPEVELGNPGAFDKPLDEYSLPPGHTAIVDTREKLSLPLDIAAIGFPPSHVSDKGILMTNPGHVDPGYKGPLTFTVINMGRKHYSLKSGDGIVTILLFQLSHQAKAGWSDRRNGAEGKGVTEGVLSALSADIVDVEKRAEKVAGREGRRTAIWVAVAPVLVGLVALIGIYLGTQATANQKITDLSEKLSVTQEKLNRLDLERRVKQLEQKASQTSTTTP
jgi:dCTP deaminase